VAFPTETVYGLGADATNTSAVRGIYSAKGRPSDNPLIVHIADLDMLDSLKASMPQTAAFSEAMQRYDTLISKFWPGPLTLLFPRPDGVLSDLVTAGLDTVGLRMPGTALARSLIKLAARPIAAPSANSSTKPSPTLASHVYDDLAGKIEYILDGGACGVGVESTVVDGLSSPPVVLRPGGVSIEEIRECAGWEGVVVGYKDESQVGKEAPRAPGMKYKHYSPDARVVLFEAGVPLDISPEAEQRGSVGVVSTTSWRPPYQIASHPSSVPEAEEIIHVEGSSESETKLVFSKVGEGRIWVQLGCTSEQVATGLFAALRGMDRLGVRTVFVEGVSDGGAGAAVMNRLRKAASVVVKS
jgi:L-threonylcarbamoyladenylate synthase